MEAYELWETSSGNLMGSFPTKQDALAALAEALHRYGPDYADSIALTCESEGESKDIASGRQLADVALKFARGRG